MLISLPCLNTNKCKNYYECGNNKRICPTKGVNMNPSESAVHQVIDGLGTIFEPVSELAAASAGEATLLPKLMTTSAISADFAGSGIGSQPMSQPILASANFGIGSQPISSLKQLLHVLIGS
ncbi:hypothetical protein ACH5RR_012943 [Cinchona calisaya]|uniref:Uncharacterized protein n=1 Tax=Cinchona calisaya TaxID=153742 RepID=A0ABD2ZYP2_9GENT